MTMDAKGIVEFIKAYSSRPMKPKELAKALRIPQSEYTGFRRQIRELLDSGKLIRLKRGRIGIADQLNVIVGIISITRGGTGFVPREDAEQDLMIPSSDLGTSLDGDKVMARLTGHSGERETGTVIKVVERVPRNIVGVFHMGKNFSYVKPDNPRFHRDLIISRKQSLDAEEGEKVVAVLTEWDQPYLNPEGKVIERIGFPGDPGVDMAAVVKGFNLPEEFPPEVLEEAERAAAGDFTRSMEDRVDLTGECLYTIDPHDAKDFDDAVSVEKTDDGYRLGVHIADVSFFVKEGTALDREALRRGNSVYLPGSVIPMLPEGLSSDVCSLRPNRRRLTHSALIDFDEDGRVLKWKTFDSVIKSRARLTYEEVQDFYDGKLSGVGKTSTRARIERVADNLTHARKLAQLLTRRRLNGGSLDLELPEARVMLDKKGEVLDIKEVERLESHRLVEEFMLAANRAVALEVFRKAKPFLYRVHERPDMEKAQAFSDMMKRLGFNFPVSPTMKPIQYAQFLAKIKGTPEAEFINELMLRSMQKAIYQRESVGHFGLAFKHYTHFTSPIRRYPDLMVHRLLRRLRSGKYDSSYAREIASTIDGVGRQCSETERLAEAAERQAVKIKQVAWMEGKLGEEFDGVVSGVMPFGFFVRLRGVGAEGLVRMSTIDDDYYYHDEDQYRITGRWSSRSFRLGDKIRVGVLKVDPVRNEIDLFLPAGANKESKSFGPAKKRPTTRKTSGKRSAKTKKKPTGTGGSRRPKKKSRKKR